MIRSLILILATLYAKVRSSAALWFQRFIRKILKIKTTVEQIMTWPDSVPANYKNWAIMLFYIIDSNCWQTFVNLVHKFTNITITSLHRQQLYLLRKTSYHLPQTADDHDIARHKLFFPTCCHYSNEFEAWASLEKSFVSTAVESLNETNFLQHKRWDAMSLSML